jgi:hypothetical protein
MRLRQPGRRTFIAILSSVTLGRAGAANAQPSARRSQHAWRQGLRCVNRRLRRPVRFRAPVLRWLNCLPQVRQRDRW